jgi:inhibitor of cysteine peptidase
MRKNNSNSVFAVFVVLILGLFIAGCTAPAGDLGKKTSDPLAEVTFDPGADITTHSFQTEDEYLAFLSARQGGVYDAYYGGVMMERSALASQDVAAAVPSKAASDESNGGAGNSYSGTNNQVASVDEADIIKTDGNYIYTTSGQTLFIIKAYPGEEAEVVSEIKFDNMPQGIFIHGDRLAVFGYISDYSFLSSEISWRPRSQFTYFNIYDISDKEDPEVVRELKFEGGYFQARLVDDKVYFVTTSYPEARNDYPTPIMYDGATLRSMPVTDIYYFPVPYDSVQLANVHSISMTDMEYEVQSKSVAVEYSQTMYMNEENLYIAYTEYINEWQIRNDITLDMVTPRLSDADRELIRKIEATDSDVLSNAEKKNKVMQLIYNYINYLEPKERQELQEELDEAVADELEKYEYMEYTIINKMSFDNGQITVDANGKLPGHVNNQFALDEHEGILRVATTISQRWNWVRPLVKENGDTVDQSTTTESTNNIFTLDEDLEVIDSVTGVAKGEQIYSTRFIGDKLYMVTFRQVDPFFVYDLSNPEDIQELGQLKIPGFSRYLHPYDENTLIGIGRDATTDGQQRGLKISLFDVSDFENPKETAKFVTSSNYANSVAEYEHKAFLFDKEKELLVIPAYSYDYTTWERPMPVDVDGSIGTTTKGSEAEEPEADSEELPANVIVDPMPGKIAPVPSNGPNGYNGAMVFRITKDDIEMRGLIDHSQGRQYWGPSVERSLYINELLYTKSEGLLRINKLSDLSSVKSIELKGYQSEYPVY